MFRSVMRGKPLVPRACLASSNIRMLHRGKIFHLECFPSSAAIRIWLGWRI